MFGGCIDFGRIVVCKAIPDWIVFIDCINIFHDYVAVDSMDGVIANGGLVEWRQLVDDILLAVRLVLLGVHHLNGIQTGIHILPDVFLLRAIGSGQFGSSLDVYYDVLVGLIDSGLREGWAVCISKSG